MPLTALHYKNGGSKQAHKKHAIRGENHLMQKEAMFILLLFRPGCFLENLLKHTFTQMGKQRLYKIKKKIV